MTEEALIGRALAEAGNVSARWLGNQALYIGDVNSPLCEDAKVMLIASVAILAERFGLGYDVVAQAHRMRNKGQARDLVELMNELLPRAD